MCVLGVIVGDLFIDCIGYVVLLIGEYYGVGMIDCSCDLFNDCVIVVQVLVVFDSVVVLQINVIVYVVGWIWDIGLLIWCGIGCVYFFVYVSDDQVIVMFDCYL